MLEKGMTIEKAVKFVKYISDRYGLNISDPIYRNCRMFPYGRRKYLESESVVAWDCNNGYTIVLTKSLHRDGGAIHVYEGNVKKVLGRKVNRQKPVATRVIWDDSIPLQTLLWAIFTGALFPYLYKKPLYAIIEDSDPTEISIYFLFTDDKIYIVKDNSFRHSDCIKPEKFYPLPKYMPVLMAYASL